MKTTSQIVSPNDARSFNELLSVFETVFDMKDFQWPSQAHLQSLLMSGGFFAVVAKSENQVIGGLTVYILTQYYAEKPQAYLYDLAVLPAHQRKGVGQSLIRFTNEYCRQKGFESTFVQAETMDADAIAFYRSTAPSQEVPALQFSYQLNQP